MDVLEVKPGAVVTWPGGGEFQPIELHVNGVPLIELVRPIELPFAEREFDERHAGGETEADLGTRGDLAGGYQYLPASLVYLPSENLLGRPYDHGFVRPPGDPRRSKSLLLGCTCSVIECWFLLARIELSETRVTWSDFEQFHRDWTYDLGPFMFDRAEYMEQLRVVAA